MTNFKLVKRAFTFTFVEDDFSCVLESQAVTTDEVMVHLIQFLRGCGYQDESIYDAMREAIDERDAFNKC
jgi:DNA-binding transcriptional regulator YhcF (GntR family)